MLKLRMQFVGCGCGWVLLWLEGLREGLWQDPEARDIKKWVRYLKWAKWRPHLCGITFPATFGCILESAMHFDRMYLVRQLRFRMARKFSCENAAKLRS